MGGRRNKGRDLFDLMGGKENTGITREEWMIAIEGIVVVNDDPDRQGRIKALVPIIDENKVWDKWIKKLVLFTGPRGYGDFHVPDKGTEVIIFGRAGGKHNLYYIPVYNEDYLTPSEFDSPKDRGIKTERDYRLMADRNLIIEAGENIRLTAANEIRLKAKGVTIEAPDGLTVNGIRIA